MQKWIETETEIDTVDWKGNPIQIKNVKAIKNSKTGELVVYPHEIARAEIKQVAECLGVMPRDVATLMMLRAKPGNFNEGDVFYKYHLQKMMFYFEQELKIIYGNSLPIDNFVAAENGPVPENLDADLKRLEENCLISTKYQKWIDEDKKQVKSKRIMLTQDGKKVANAIWSELPKPYKVIALRVKRRIYPLNPKQVRNIVHKQYPKYKDVYVKNDIE